MEVCFKLNSLLNFCIYLLLTPVGGASVTIREPLPALIERLTFIHYIPALSLHLLGKKKKNGEKLTSRTLGKFLAHFDIK